MSYRKKIDFHVNHRRSKHWDADHQRLRNDLLSNRGAGETEFQASLDQLRSEYGNLFNYTPQWPIFIESKGQMQAFFIDFIIPKFKLCIEIDDQEDWEWRSSLIRTEGFFVARYDSKILLNGLDFIKDSVIHLAQMAMPDHDLKKTDLKPLMYTDFLIPLKYRGKRSVGRGKYKAKLDIHYAKCARCGGKTWHVNDHVKKARYCPVCEETERLFLLSVKENEMTTI